MINIYIYYIHTHTHTHTHRDSQFDFCFMDTNIKHSKWTVLFCWINPKLLLKKCPCVCPRGVSARWSTLCLLVASSPASCGAAGQLAESRWSLCPRHCGATGPLWGNRAGAHPSEIMGGTDKTHTSSHNENSSAHTHTHLIKWWCQH